MTWLADLTLETVVVHLTNDGPSLKGLKAAVHDDCLVLREVVVLGDASNDVLSGDIVVPREQVMFLQRVSAS